MQPAQHLGPLELLQRSLFFKEMIISNDCRELTSWSLKLLQINRNGWQLLATGAYPP